jgi:hypothetical protein
MIDRVLGFIVDGLDAALQSQFPSSGSLAVMGRMGGGESPALENKVIVSVANLEREAGTERTNTPRGGGPPPLDFNLYILVAANFDNYAAALKFLSASVVFFQSRPVMTPATSPGFPAGIDRLTIEFVNLSLQDLSNLWTVRGSLYLPSFLLKLRTITLATNT